MKEWTPSHGGAGDWVRMLWGHAQAHPQRPSQAIPDIDQNRPAFSSPRTEAELSSCPHGDLCGGQEKDGQSDQPTYGTATRASIPHAGGDRAPCRCVPSARVQLCWLLVSPFLTPHILLVTWLLLNAKRGAGVTLKAVSPACYSCQIQKTANKNTMPPNDIL